MEGSAPVHQEVTDETPSTTTMGDHSGPFTRQSAPIHGSAPTDTSDPSSTSTSTGPPFTRQSAPVKGFPTGEGSDLPASSDPSSGSTTGPPFTRQSAPVKGFPTPETSTVPPPVPEEPSTTSGLPPTRQSAPIKGFPTSESSDPPATTDSSAYSSQPHEHEHKKHGMFHKSHEPQHDSHRHESTTDPAFLGNIDSTASPHDPKKHWKFSDGDFGFHMPTKPSNAQAQGVKHDGTVDPSAGAPGPHGLADFEKGNIDSIVSPGTGTKHFKVGSGKEYANTGEYGVRRDGSVSHQGGMGPGEAAQTLEDGQHDAAKHWKFSDGDGGFGMPNKPSNKDAQGL